MSTFYNIFSGGICIKTLGPVGGDDGQSFSEEDLFFQSHGNISKIEIRHAFFVNW